VLLSFELQSKFEHLRVWSLSPFAWIIYEPVGLGATVWALWGLLWGCNQRPSLIIVVPEIVEIVVAVVAVIINNIFIINVLWQWASLANHLPQD